jgi:hypothetical protein
LVIFIVKGRFLLGEAMEAVVVIEEEGVFFCACDQLWRRETIGLGLNIEHRPMQLHANST